MELEEDHEGDKDWNSLRNISVHLYKDVKLQGEHLEILSLLLSNPDLSPYDIYKLKKDAKYLSKHKIIGTWYEQIERRLAYLHDKGLIELVTPQPSIRRGKSTFRKPYRLTSNGLIFFLINDLIRFPEEIILLIMKNYDNNLLFRIFLYPFITQNTLFDNKRSAVFRIIVEYLKEICETLPQKLNQMNSLVYYTDGKGYILKPLFIWPTNNSVFCTTFEDLTLREYLQNEHSWNWVQDSKIVADFENNIITINDPKNSAHKVEIYINTEEKIATLRYNGHKQDSLIFAIDSINRDKQLSEELALHEPSFVVGKSTETRTSAFLINELVLSCKNHIQSFHLELKKEMDNDERTKTLLINDSILMGTMKFLKIA